MRRASILFAALFLMGSGHQAEGAPPGGDLALDVVHGYAYTGTATNVYDSNGQPVLYPRQIGSVSCADLDEVKKALQTLADQQLAAVKPLSGARHGAILVILNSPKAMARHYIFSPDYPARDEVQALMDAQGHAVEKLFADALQKSALFATVSVTESDTPAADGFDGFQYKIWMDDKLEDKPGSKSLMGWVLANAKGERRPVAMAVGYGNTMTGLPQIVTNLQKAAGEIPME